VNGKSVSARDVELATIAFTTDRDGWVFGRACLTSENTSCQPILIVTHDGTAIPGQMPLPQSLSGYRFYSLAHPTALDGWIVASGKEPEPARLVVTHDGGLTWRDQTGPTGLRLSYSANVFFLDAKRGFLAAGGQPGAGNQLKEIDGTVDGGTTWTKLTATGTFGSGASPVGKMATAGYLAASAGTFHFVSLTVGWLVLARAGLIRTSDGGRTWDQTSRGPEESLQSLHFADPRTAWLVEGRHVFATADGGDTWQTITSID
jgi:photosystem II stability/assembly factor-like uncharacterized protein